MGKRIERLYEMYAGDIYVLSFMVVLSVSSTSGIACNHGMLQPWYVAHVLKPELLVL